jgi:hypothetical protein
VTFYPPSSVQKHPNTTRICSSAEHPDCTPELVYETMLSQARFQTRTPNRTKVGNCQEVEAPDPVTIVIDGDGLEATNYTRPGHPLHPGKATRIVKQQGDDVVVETAGAGKLRREDFNPIDQDLIAAVRGRLKPQELKSQEPALQEMEAQEPEPQETEVQETEPEKPEDAFEMWKKDPASRKKKPPEGRPMVLSLASQFNPAIARG